MLCVRDGSSKVERNHNGSLQHMLVYWLNCGQLDLQIHLSPGLTGNNNNPGYGSAYLTSNWLFRIPSWCQLVSSVIVALGVFFLPESPRWLVAQDRVDEARAILGKYHGEGELSSTQDHQYMKVDSKLIVESRLKRSPNC